MHMNINSAVIYKKIYTFLSKAGVLSPAFEASVIFEAVVGKKYIESCDDDINEEKIRNIERILKKREKRLPLQYILGEWEFWGLKFKVGEGVLIPRPDTEILVEVALNSIKVKKSPIIVDLCSGSGCIAIALAKEREDAQIYAIEKFSNAYRYLLDNIKLNNINNIKPYCEDIFCVEELNLFDKVDMIVSNPPYIPTDEIKKLEKEIQYEPECAFDGGDDGLYFYREILDKWCQKLKPGGDMILEIGYNQYEDVKNLFILKGLIDIKCIKDIGGINRVISGKMRK